MTDNDDQTAPKNSATDPPAANQPKDEPFPTAPDDSAQAGDQAGDQDAAAAGSSSRARHDQGEAPTAMEVDDVRAAANLARTGTLPAEASGGIPTPGDAKGVAVPAVQAAMGTSEGKAAVDGVKIPANAPPGKPDGEVDTRG